MKLIISITLVAGFIAVVFSAPADHHHDHDGHSHAHNHSSPTNETAHSAGHDHSHEHHNHTDESSHSGHHGISFHHGHDHGHDHHHHHSHSSNHSHQSDHYENDGHTSHQPGDKVHSLDLHVKCHGEYLPSTQCANGTNSSNLYWFDMGKNVCNKYENGKCPSEGSKNSFTSMDDCLKCIVDGNAIQGSLNAKATLVQKAPASTASTASSTSAATPSTVSSPQPSSTTVTATTA